MIACNCVSLTHLWVSGMLFICKEFDPGQLLKEKKKIAG